jgi:enamine deaminase RidA (YjgF/YER057c/UK114 family)
MSPAVLPEGWERPVGYSEGWAVRLAGTLISVAGQLGVEGEHAEGGAPGFVEQWRTALERVLAIVRAGGGDAASVVSLRMFVTDLSAYGLHGRELGAAYREVFGRHHPAVTMVEVSKVAHPDALIEIEALAVTSG